MGVATWPNLHNTTKPVILNALLIVPAFAAKWQQIPPNYVNLKCDFFYKVKVS
jgi:hypothetical protein